MKTEKYIKDFKLTGNVEVNVENIVADWNHLWRLSQWKDNFRLIRFIRKDSEGTHFKVTISDSNAKSLIDALGLKSYPHPLFKSGTTWKS